MRLTLHFQGDDGVVFFTDTFDLAPDCDSCTITVKSPGSGRELRMGSHESKRTPTTGAAEGGGAGE